MDYRYVLLIVIVILVIWFLLPECSKKDYFYQDQANFDGDHRIIINQELLDKFVDILLGHANNVDNKEDRTLQIYMATYFIFVLNFNSNRLEQLDKNLEGVKLVKHDIAYPSFKKYHNLQAAIANSVGKELTDTERRFTGNPEDDRKMVDVYLSTLFDMFDIIQIQ